MTAAISSFSLLPLLTISKPALLQYFTEALAQLEVSLVLRTLQELFHFMLAWSKLLLLLVGKLSCLEFLISDIRPLSFWTASLAKPSCEHVADGVAYSRAYGNPCRSRGHLHHQAKLLRRRSTHGGGRHWGPSSRCWRWCFHVWHPAGRGCPMGHCSHPAAWQWGAGHRPASQCHPTPAGHDGLEGHIRGQTSTNKLFLKFLSNISFWLAACVCKCMFPQVAMLQK